MRRAPTRAGSVLVLVLALAACGAGSGEEAAVEALATDLRDNETFEEGDISEDEAECAAERVVGVLGVDRVGDVGYTDDGDQADLDALSDDEIGTLARSLARCIDGIDGVLVDAARRTVLDGGRAGLPRTEEDAECVARSLVDGLGVERLLIVNLAADGDLFVEGSLTGAEADTVANGFVDCVDTRAILVEQFEAQDLPRDLATCLAEEIPEESLREFIASEFSGRPVDPESLLEPALGICGLA